MKNRLALYFDKISKLEVSFYMDGGLFETSYVKPTGGSIDNNRFYNTIHVLDGSSRMTTIRVGNNADDHTPAIKYIVGDHLNNSTVVLTASGSLINREEYYPFGETSFGGFQYKRYRYNGKEKDEESGLYEYGQRYYSPWTCRFISVDPLAAKFADLSPYNYAGNRPITKADIDGLQEEDRQGTPSGGGESQQSDSDSNKPNETTQKTQVHSVKSGETLSKIADKYGTTVDAIAEVNDISDPNKIQVGQKLNIGGTSTGSDNLSEPFDFSSLVTQPDNTRVAMPIIPDYTQATETPEQTVLDSPVGDVPITSKFLDTRTCEECSQTHGGTDYGVAIGTNAQSTANGVVARSYNSGTYGNTVIINHGAAASDSTQNVYTLYAHGSARLVNEGDTVSVGDTIMRSGNTGNSTEPHLHYEVIQTEHLPTQSAFFGNLNFRYSPQELRTLIQ